MSGAAEPAGEKTFSDRDLARLCEAVDEERSGTLNSRIRREMRHLIEQDPRTAFAELAAQLLSATEPLASALRHVALSITSYACYLCEGQDFESGTAVRIAEILSAGGAHVDIDVAHAAAEFARADATEPALRALALLDRLAKSARVLPILLPMLNLRQPQVRSKVAGIIATIHINPAWLNQRLSDRDPRVRANLIEHVGAADADLIQIRDILLRFAGDPNNRVAGNALLKLYQLGFEDLARPQIAEMVRSKGAPDRATAAWVMGRTGCLKFRESLHALRCDEASPVRWSALRALVQLAKAGTHGEDAGTGKS